MGLKRAAIFLALAAPPSAAWLVHLTSAPPPEAPDRTPVPEVWAPDCPHAERPLVAIRDALLDCKRLIEGRQEAAPGLLVAPGGLAFGLTEIEPTLSLAAGCGKSKKRSPRCRALDHYQSALAAYRALPADLDRASRHFHEARRVLLRADPKSPDLRAIDLAIGAALARVPGKKEIALDALRRAVHQSGGGAPDPRAYFMAGVIRWENTPADPRIGANFFLALLGARKSGDRARWRGDLSLEHAATTNLILAALATKSAACVEPAPGEVGQAAAIDRCLKRLQADLGPARKDLAAAQVSPYFGPYLAEALVFAELGLAATRDACKRSAPWGGEESVCRSMHLAALSAYAITADHLAACGPELERLLVRAGEIADVLVESVPEASALRLVGKSIRREIRLRRLPPAELLTALDVPDRDLACAPGRGTLLRQGYGGAFCQELARWHHLGDPRLAVLGEPELARAWLHEWSLADPKGRAAKERLLPDGSPLGPVLAMCGADPKTSRALTPLFAPTPRRLEWNRPSVRWGLGVTLVAALAALTLFVRNLLWARSVFGRPRP